MQTPFKSGFFLGLGVIASMLVGSICFALLGVAANASDDTSPARNLIVTRDKVTGCEYLIYAGTFTAAPMGPRIDAAGKPICSAAK